MDAQGFAVDAGEAGARYPHGSGCQAVDRRQMGKVGYELTSERRRC